MDLAEARTEPLCSLIHFHNQLNKSIKFTFGALAKIREQESALRAKGLALHLPTGDEPWNTTRTWRNIALEADAAQKLITEMGIARAATAFEEYLLGALTELDRGNGETPEADVKNKLGRLLARLELKAERFSCQIAMVEFFDCARNCIVHRLGRANKELAKLAASEKFERAMTASSRPRAKWKPSIPAISAGKPIDLQPRHAIMASGAYHRLASDLDFFVVPQLGTPGFIRMASHWSLLAESTVNYTARLSPEIVVRSLLQERYGTKRATLGEIVTILRDIDKWKDVRAAFAARFGSMQK